MLNVLRLYTKLLSLSADCAYLQPCNFAQTPLKYDIPNLSTTRIVVALSTQQASSHFKSSVNMVYCSQSLCVTSRGYFHQLLISHYCRYIWEVKSLCTLGSVILPYSFQLLIYLPHLTCFVILLMRQDEFSASYVRQSASLILGVSWVGVFHYIRIFVLSAFIFRVTILNSPVH